MSEYERVTDLNEVAELKRKGECYYKSNFEENLIELSRGLSTHNIYLDYEYYKKKQEPFKKPLEKFTDNDFSIAHTQQTIRIYKVINKMIDVLRNGE